MPKQHPIVVLMAWVIGVPIGIWLLVLMVGVISSIGEWFGYSSTQ